jgi:hypothetical protein
MTTPAEWEVEQDQAMSIYDSLRRARLWCKLNPTWDFSINLNGAIFNTVVVKVWFEGSVLKTFHEPAALSDTLIAATRLMGATREWYRSQGSDDGVPDPVAVTTSKKVVWSDYARCFRCQAAPMMPCRRIGTKEQKAYPHQGRTRFRRSGV